MLPLTEAQRAMGASGREPSGCWLVVEKAGHGTWCEPVPCGLASYLGSRVILRRLRDDDAFGDVPWPPAIVTLATTTSSAPWLAAGWVPPTMDRRGAAGSLQSLPAIDAARIAVLELRVTAAGATVAGATIALDDASFHASTPPAPMRTDAQGRLEVRVPPGEHRVRVAAPGHLMRDLVVELDANGRTRRDVELSVARAVDVLAVGTTGVAVPFQRLDVIPKDTASGRESFFVFSDSCGRARLFLDRPDAWFVYADLGPGTRRVDLDAANAGADGFIRVTKKQPVTVRITGDDWPRHGWIRWLGGDGQTVMRAFECGVPQDRAVVMRMVYRDDACTTVGGDGGVPFTIRATDLPPARGEPLLDLVALDRTLRPRATLEPRSASGRNLIRFAVAPPWQAELAIAQSEAVRFGRRQDGGWTLLARDDEGLDLVALATGHQPLPFTVPAAAPGATLPVVPLELTPR